MFRNPLILFHSGNSRSGYFSVEKCYKLPSLLKAQPVCRLMTLFTSGGFVQIVQTVSSDLVLLDSRAADGEFFDLVRELHGESPGPPPGEGGVVT